MKKLIKRIVEARRIKRERYWVEYELGRIAWGYFGGPVRYTLILIISMFIWGFMLVGIDKCASAIFCQDKTQNDTTETTKDANPSGAHSCLSPDFGNPELQNGFKQNMLGGQSPINLGSNFIEGHFFIFFENRIVGFESIADFYILTVLFEGDGVFNEITHTHTLASGRAPNQEKLAPRIRRITITVEVA